LIHPKTVKKRPLQYRSNQRSRTTLTLLKTLNVNKK